MADNKGRHKVRASVPANPLKLLIEEVLSHLLKLTSARLI
jgi:hypothetical protein